MVKETAQSLSGARERIRRRGRGDGKVGSCGPREVKVKSGGTIKSGGESAFHDSRIRPVLGVNRLHKSGRAGPEALSHRELAVEAFRLADKLRREERRED